MEQYFTPGRGMKPTIAAPQRVGIEELTKAIHENNLSRVEKELRSGANPNQNIYISGLSKILPLAYTATTGNVPCAELLVKHGANIDKVSGMFAPLHYAIVFRHERMLEFLLTRNADCNVKNTVGDTPLHIAAQKSNLHAVKFLLSISNIDATLENNEHKLPADLADDSLIRKLILRKFHEQQRQKLDAEICQLEDATLNKNIIDKESELKQMNLGVESVMEELAEKSNELETIRMKIPLVEIEIEELRNKKSKRGLKRKTDDTLECPLCWEIPFAPLTVFQCKNKHIYCSKCAAKPAMNHCPKCGVEIKTERIRNLEMEKLISNKRVKMNGTDFVVMDEI